MEHDIYSKDSEITSLVRELAGEIHDYYSIPTTVQPRNSQMLDHTSPPPPPLSSTQSHSLYDDGIQKFTKFLEKSLNTLKPQTAQNIPDSLQKKITTNLDKFLAIREMAPSRQHFNLHIKTSGTPRALLFSIIIFRGITFGTESSRSKQVYFTNLEDWNNFYQTLDTNRNLKKNMAILCIKNIYGSPIPGQGPEHATKYWELTADWEDYLNSFGAGKPHYQSAFLEMEKKKLPQIGPLMTHLIIADLVYAEVVYPPTIEEIAWIIVRLQCGALKCLRMLNLLPSFPGSNKIIQKQRANCIQEVQVALNDLDKAILKEVETEEVRVELKYDWIFIEHALCKYMRLVGK
jgi:hypothetical protein